MIGSWILYKRNEVLEKTTYLSPELTHTLTNMKGEVLQLADLKGKKIYLKFWATWCPICLAGLEDFQTLFNDLDKKENVVLSVVTPSIRGEMSKHDFIEWAKAQELSFPIYFDETGLLLSEFDIQAYPSSVYLKKDGSIFKTKIGDEANEKIKETLSLY